jgi:indolepyruvate ferredoxin oxidoreductase
MAAFRLLARLRGLRGGPFDLFGMSAERRHERALVKDYEALVEELSAKLDHDNHRLAVALASLPEQIRGYGHIKEANLARAKAREAELLAAFRDPAARPRAAE